MRRRIRRLMTRRVKLPLDQARGSLVGRCLGIGPLRSGADEYEASLDRRRTVMAERLRDEIRELSG